MPRDFLHNHPEFAELIRIVSDQHGIDPVLVEKDYWIMHRSGSVGLNRSGSLDKWISAFWVMLQPGPVAAR